MNLRWARLVTAVMALVLCGSVWLAGQTPGADATTSSENDGWFERVSRTQAEQPHWITPLATVTPRLEEEFRFDFIRQQLPGGGQNANFGAGKGLEIIPARNIEVILTVPAYVTHNRPGAQNGWGDSGFLVKYRLCASNETKGNYILTVFFATSFPTATHGNGAPHAVFTPTIAAGKGWGNFDVQSTFSVGIPSAKRSLLGTPLAWNTAFQYRVLKKLWPELEVNSTFWPNGTLGGEKQAFLTPGLVIGRIPLHNRLGLTFGTGMQIAATRFHPYNHAWIFSVRCPF